MPPRDRPHASDPRALPAPAPPAGGRRDLSPRHAPRRLFPAPGAARHRADAGASGHAQADDLVRAAAARPEAPDRGPAQVIQPEWAVPARVRTLVTTREFGDLADEGA